jgi:hypothetical protein
MGRIPLPLDVIDVASPCPRSWEGMAGDDVSRLCAGCALRVYNLSAMSRSDAEQLVCERAGRVCVRFERGGDGVVRTLDYFKPERRRRGWRFWSVVGASGAILAAAVQACAPRGRAPAGPPVVMGMLPPPTVVHPAPPPQVPGAKIDPSIVVQPPADSGDEAIIIPPLTPSRPRSSDPR